MHGGRNTFNAFFVESKINAIQISTTRAFLFGFLAKRFFRLFEKCIACCSVWWQVDCVESENLMNKFEAYLKTLGQDILNDLSCHDWSGVSLSALYAAVGANSEKEKATAKREARSWAEHMVSRRS